MKISTVKLKSMIANLMKGVGDNKLLPLTTLIAIEVKDGKLTMTSTDGNNYLVLKEDQESEDFYVCIYAAKFAKLVSKLTCDSVDLTISDGNLHVDGNGHYIIDIPLDEDGGIIAYPNPASLLNTDGEDMGRLSKLMIHTTLVSVKSALATRAENSLYSNYYLDSDVILATDGKMVNMMKLISSNINKPVLIEPNTMDLLSISDSDMSVKMYPDSGKLVFLGDNVSVYANIQDGLQRYQINDLKAYAEQGFDHYCVLPKDELLSLLDRLSLFIGDYDNGTIILQFTKDGMKVSSRNSSGVELIPYESPCEDFDDTSRIMVSINMLQTQIKAADSEKVVLHYGNDKTIKLTNDDIDLSAIIALFQE